MKAIVFFASLFVLAAMGVSLGYFFKNAPRYQSESAQQMKEVFLKQGQVEITVFSGLKWIFAAEPERWHFELQGGLLKVRPPLPQGFPDLEAGQKLQDLPDWNEFRTGLTLALRNRLKIGTNSTAQIEILPPEPPAAAQ